MQICWASNFNNLGEKWYWRWKIRTWFQLTWTIATLYRSQFKRFLSFSLENDRNEFRFLHLAVWWRRKTKFPLTKEIFYFKNYRYFRSSFSNSLKWSRVLKTCLWISPRRVSWWIKGLDIWSSYQKPSYAALKRRKELSKRSNCSHNRLNITSWRLALLWFSEQMYSEPRRRPKRESNVSLGFRQTFLSPDPIKMCQSPHFSSQRLLLESSCSCMYSRRPNRPSCSRTHIAYSGQIAQRRKC